MPVYFKNLDGTKYNLTKTYLDGRSDKKSNLQPVDAEIKLDGEKAVIMPANTIVELELVKMQ